LAMPVSKKTNTRTYSLFYSESDKLLRQ
jgi:hypothetical protein